LTWNANGKVNIEGNDVLTFSSTSESNLTEFERKNFKFWENLGEFRVLCPVCSAVLLCTTPKHSVVHLRTAPASKAQCNVSTPNAFNFWPISPKERDFFSFLGE